MFSLIQLCKVSARFLIAFCSLALANGHKWRISQVAVQCESERDRKSVAHETENVIDQKEMRARLMAAHTIYCTCESIFRKVLIRYKSWDSWDMESIRPKNINHKMMNEDIDKSFRWPAWNYRHACEYHTNNKNDSARWSLLIVAVSLYLSIVKMLSCTCQRKLGDLNAYRFKARLTWKNVNCCLLYEDWMSEFLNIQYWNVWIIIE